MRHVVIGTAGHVDHGKTALVKALTGTDTDRLAEERRRGITIELGFAHCALEGVDAGIVDVPGHEDFVRTMVAGATGVDVALLVVAADESVMPQTIEHSAILEFLAVPVGVVAVTKADLVEPAWLDMVRTDIRDRLAESRVTWQAIVPVSSVTGEGLPELRAALATAAAAARPRRADDLFRLPVDRAFSVAGAGTVVTGTAWSGSVKVGDEIRVLPGDARGRVRGVQSHGEQQSAAIPGRRTALAVTGIGRQEAGRGTTVVAGQGWRETDVLDVVLTLLPTAPPLGQRTRVRVHLGTVEVLARVTPAAVTGIAPGTTGDARLRLETPVVARWGDRLVVRAYSPVTTVGGGIVADPWPAARPRRPHDLAVLLTDPRARLAGAVQRAGDRGIAVDDLAVRLGLAPPELPSLIAQGVEAGEFGRVGSRLIAVGALDTARSRIEAELATHHAAFPLEPGMAREAVRRLVADTDVADAALDALVAAGRCVVEGQTARLAAHEVRVAGADAAVVEKMRNAIEAAGFEGMTPDEAGVGAVRGTLGPRATLEFLERNGEAVRIGRDRYVATGIMKVMLGRIREALGATGQLRPAQLRDLFGLTRKFSIPLLEWLDGSGYTVRQGDIRVAGPRLTEGPDRS
jgi:selenocysteine-specific elongation factor